MESNTKPLNLKEALELYDIIGKYLPDTLDDRALDFMDKIISKIIDDGSSAYVDAICLMTKYKVSDLQLLESEELLILFMDSMTQNQIINLQKFCEEIGYAR